MNTALRRCKSIVSGILLSAGEARGEAVSLTTVAGFLDELVAEWRRLHPNVPCDYRLVEPLDATACRRTPIVSDSALRQVIFSVLENAREASPAGIGLTVRCIGDWLSLTVSDQGPGFPPEMLANLGKPYQSSKGRAGGGLGLFLVVNVLRKLGGRVHAVNKPAGGAEVSLELPLASLQLGDGNERHG